MVNEIFEKDIRRRAKIKDKEAFEAVRHFIINNFGATTSINSFQEALAKNGLNITRATVNKFISVLVNTKTFASLLCFYLLQILKKYCTMKGY